MSKIFAGRDLKSAFEWMLDAFVKREMPNNLNETQYMEYADLQLYGKMREMQTAMNEYVDTTDDRLNRLEIQLNELNNKLLEKGVI